MVDRKFTVHLKPAEEGGFIVKCLEFPIASQGETQEEALANIKEVIKATWKPRPKLWIAESRAKKLSSG